MNTPHKKTEYNKTTDPIQFIRFDWEDRKEQIQQKIDGIAAANSMGESRERLEWVLTSINRFKGDIEKLLAYQEEDILNTEKEDNQ